MNIIKIEYRFNLPDDQQEVFPIQLDADTLELIGNITGTLPQWTQLEFKQCPNCSLSAQNNPHCPLSANLVDIVARSENVLSYERIDIDIITHDRRICLNSSAQAGFSSLMGLVMATSGCPHMVFFRPMARFHHPLADEEETLYRAASTYLLAQYFQRKHGEPSSDDFEGLNQIYENIQLVNEMIAERLKYASESDLSANAVTILDLFAKVIPFFVQDRLESIRYLFTPYLKECEAGF